MERQQSEERARIERTAQEERNREDSRRSEEQRRQDDRRRQDDERKRSEQQKREDNRRQENQRREQGAHSEIHLHESTAKTPSEKTAGNAQAQYAREKGVAYVETSSVINSIYRNINAQNRAQHGVDGKPLSEGQLVELRAKNPGNRHSTTESERGQKTEGTAIERHQAQVEPLKDKVQARINAWKQSMSQNRTR